jgi:hypothetical protein
MLPALDRKRTPDTIEWMTDDLVPFCSQRKFRVNSRFRQRIFCFMLVSMLCGTLWAVDGVFHTITPVAEQYAVGFSSIAEGDSEQILRHLVEGDLAGRGTGQEGFLKAAKWFASQLELNGFQPAGDNGSWFQNVPVHQTYGEY